MRRHYSVVLCFLFAFAACIQPDNDICSHVSISSAGIQIDDCATTSQNLSLIEYDQYQRMSRYNFEITCDNGISYSGTVSDVKYSNGAASSATVNFTKCDGEGAHSCDSQCSWNG